MYVITTDGDVALGTVTSDILVSYARKPIVLGPEVRKFVYFVGTIRSKAYYSLFLEKNIHSNVVVIFGSLEGCRGRPWGWGVAISKADLSHKNTVFLSWRIASEYV